jgi:predicted flavoprotein YhiN
MTDYDVVSAASMVCAAPAGQRRRSVLLIERHYLLGEKIRISGGGRCNFTNTGAGPANFLSQNPDLCRAVLARCTPARAGSKARWDCPLL